MEQRREDVTSAGQLLVGRVLSVISLVFCVPVGALFVSVAMGAIGIVLGVVGYALGARWLGLLAVVLCTVAMFVGLLVGPFAMPNDFYDRAVDGWFREIPTERFTEE